jgi:quaternary ammonium compound-resistance protein SugE
LKGRIVTMAWVYLLIAAACEMVWPIGFKYTNGFREHYGVVAITFGIMGLSLWLVSVAIHHGMHVGSAYAVWTGLGAAGTAVLGMILYHEPRDWQRIACLILIIGGAVGLKAVSPPPQGPQEAAQIAPAATEH